MFPMSADRWEFYPDRSGKWRWKRIDGYNSKIVATSAEGFVEKDDCMNNANANGRPTGRAST